jgi:hypothetical protein
VKEEAKRNVVLILLCLVIFFQMEAYVVVSAGQCEATPA